MNPLFERILYQLNPRPKANTDPGVSPAPVAAESTINFKLKRHLDGKYSFEVKSEKSKDKKLDAYAKWLAGSIVRSLRKFNEIASYVDPEGIEKSSWEELAQTIED